MFVFVFYNYYSVLSYEVMLAVANEKLSGISQRVTAHDENVYCMICIYSNHQKHSKSIDCVSTK